MFDCLCVVEPALFQIFRFERKLEPLNANASMLNSQLEMIDDAIKDRQTRLGYRSPIPDESVVFARARIDATLMPIDNLIERWTARKVKLEREVMEHFRRKAERERERAAANAADGYGYNNNNNNNNMMNYGNGTPAY